MMNNLATAAFGTTLTWDGASVLGLTAINGFGVTVDTIDVTNHLSTSGYEELVAGIKRTKEITLEGYFDYADSTGQVAMASDIGASKTWTITFPSGTGATWTGTGILIDFHVGDAPFDGVIGFSATIKTTGVPTFAVATVTGMSAISFSNDVLMMPAFAIGEYGIDNPYVVTITALETSTVITPVDETSGEVITIYTDGGSAQVVATGEASSACTLDVDDVTIIDVVISHATKASKTYRFNCAVLAG